MNRIEISGMVFGDRTLRQTKNGNFVYSFTIGNKQSKSKEDSLHFFRVQAWNDLAHRLNAEIYEKCIVELEGYLTQRKWKSKDGKNQSVVEIIAHRCELVKQNYQPREMSVKKDEPIYVNEKSIIEEERDFPF